MRRLLGGLLTLGLVAGSASACINDRELPSHEREFRAEYARNAHPIPKVRGSHVPSSGVLAIGSALLGGALVGVVRISNRAKG